MDSYYVLCNSSCNNYLYFNILLDKHKDCTTSVLPLIPKGVFLILLYYLSSPTQVAADLFCIVPVKQLLLALDATLISQQLVLAKDQWDKAL
jgi:hypothetical protein